MTNGTPFRTKARSYRTPFHMLRALAALDATLVYRRGTSGVEIGFEVPRRHHAELEAILAAKDHAGHAWRLAYLAAVLNLLAIDDSSTEPPSDEARQLRLRAAFVEFVPESGAEAFRLFAALNDAVGHHETERPRDRWLSAVSRRNDILRILQDSAGTAFAVDAAREAQRWAQERGIGGAA